MPEEKTESVEASTAEASASAAAPNPDAWKEGVKFPELKGPQTFYDDDRDEAWVGIPLKLFADKVDLLATIDGAKASLLFYYVKVVQKYMQREALKASPRGNRITEMLKKTFGADKPVIH